MDGGRVVGIVPDATVAAAAVKAPGTPTHVPGAGPVGTPSNITVTVGLMRAPLTISPNTSPIGPTHSTAPAGRSRE